MKILVLNSGSSSLKFKVFGLPGLKPIAWGVIEEIGGKEGKIRFWVRGEEGTRMALGNALRCSDHRAAIARMSSIMEGAGVIDSFKRLYAIGHRVVHGGEHFKEPAIIDEKVIETIKDIIPLAPLHNPANLTGIEVALEHAPDVPQVAVFDTAFHQSIPRHAFLYGIPMEYYKRFGIRRYGFHGTSHSYVMKRCCAHLHLPMEKARIITVHLGNGASMAAIQGGRCVDTSMGFTPLEGLMMGTRSGDIDPAIILYLERSHAMTPQEIDEMLNKESGLKGVCGESDMRAIEKRAGTGDAVALLAIEMFAYRVKKYIGAYCAALGGVDAICFTGGIGENSKVVRKACLSGLSGLGIELDDRLNDSLGVPLSHVHEITKERSRVRVLVVPTDEEYEIAQQTLGVVRDVHAKK